MAAATASDAKAAATTAAATTEGAAPTANTAGTAAAAGPPLEQKRFSLESTCVGAIRATAALPIVLCSGRTVCVN